MLSHPLLRIAIFGPSENVITNEIQNYCVFHFVCSLALFFNVIKVNKYKLKFFLKTELLSGNSLLLINCSSHNIRINI